MNPEFSGKKIPTLVALLVIVLGIFGTSFLVQNLRPIFTRATVTEKPKEVKITNISSTSFVVSWITDDEVVGSLRFWDKEQKEQTALDTRDNPGNLGNYRVHYLQVSSLKPNTEYFFVLSSGKDSYDSNGTPHQVTTAAELTPSLEKKTSPIQGTVVDENGLGASNVLVYASLEGAQNISSPTSKNGEWILPQSIRTTDLKKYYELKEGETIQLLITNGKLSSNVKALVSNKIPPLILGQDYDFSLGTEEVGGKEATASQKTSSKFSLTPPLQTITSPKIISPKEGENFKDVQPRFSGTAPKGVTVKIIIESPEPLGTTIKADNNGNWSYRPASPLPPGDHTITIIASDSNGITRTISQKFKVFAQGQQISESATPSATPTLKLSPTPQPTLAPTDIPIPTKAPSPIPVTGDNLPILIFLVFGAMTFLAGIALLF